jgi:hypothetical protein
MSAIISIFFVLLCKHPTLINIYFFDSSLFVGIGPILVARVKWLGAGDFVPPMVLSPSVPRNTVKGILSEARYTEKAQLLETEI